MMPTKPPRKRQPPLVAVVNQNGCTGCEICIAVCPVDCLEIAPGVEYHANFMKLIEVDLERCIGCQLCAKVCPWATITMEPYQRAWQQAPSVTLRSVVPGQRAAAAHPATP